MKSITESINEAREIDYRVQFLAGGNVVDASITIEKNDQKVFEDFLENEQDNIFSHAEGGNIEY